MLAFAASEKPGRQHPSVVQDEEVARSEQTGKFEKNAVAEFTRIAVEVQQTRRSAIRQRLLRDQFLGKVKIEVRNQHG